jgi:hypothetical protein
VAGPVELGEARLVLSHVSLTPQPPGTFTRPRPARADRDRPPPAATGDGQGGDCPTGPAPRRSRLTATTGPAPLALNHARLAPGLPGCSAALGR